MASSSPEIGFSDSRPGIGRSDTFEIQGEDDDGSGQLTPIPVDMEARLWLARELHDTVGTTLAAMLLDMELLKRRGDGASLRDEIELLQSSTRHVLSSMRRLLSGLRNEPEHDGRFVDLVYEAMDRFERQSGMQTALVAGPGWPQSMPARTAHHLLRIVEEAMQNARRHSHAGMVEITLEVVGEDAVLTVRDDGRGLQDLPGGHGQGITGMREYAVLAGCELQIESFPDRGTAVRVLLPLEICR